MNEYLLAWNPKNWVWPTAQLDEVLATAGKPEATIMRWSCANVTAINANDHFWIIRLGPDEPKGIFGHGTIVTGCYEAPHYSKPNKKCQHVDCRFDSIVDPRIQVEIHRETLLTDELLLKQNWSRNSQARK
jgi:hypothetical protein